MTFLWPQFLWLLLTLPLLVGAYVWLLRRKKKRALRYASLALVKEAMSAGQQVRRHIPPLLFLLSLAAMLVAGARPFSAVTLPSAQETIILAMDVSGSMRATDVKPNRLVASQNAAKAFLAELPRHVRVGLVAFAGTAAVVQPPTLSRPDLTAAIDKFQLQHGTAIGNGIVVSLAELMPQARIDLESLQSDPDGQNSVSLDEPLKAHKEEKKTAKNFSPAAPGSYASGAIILLTDGQRTTGIDSIDAAKAAAERGVRVYTVGIGTVEGETIGIEGWSMRVRLDEDALKDIARTTRADYFYAGTAGDLKKVYETLSARLTVEKKETEISALLALAAAALALLSASLSLLWFNRIL